MADRDMRGLNASTSHARVQDEPIGNDVGSLASVGAHDRWPRIRLPPATGNRSHKPVARRGSIEKCPRARAASESPGGMGRPKWLSSGRVKTPPDRFPPPRRGGGPGGSPRGCGPDRDQLGFAAADSKTVPDAREGLAAVTARRAARLNGVGSRGSALQTAVGPRERAREPRRRSAGRRCNTDCRGAW